MAWDGLLTEAKPIPCNCGHRNNFRIIYYLNADVVPNYREELIAGEKGIFVCAGCGAELSIRAPIIAEFPSRDLVVFATPAGDDEGLENGFLDFFAKLRDHLPSHIAESITRRPYTFVEGRHGLNSLICHFHGDDVSAGVDSDPGTLEAIQSLSGYIYGDLFFYFPGQLAAQELVGLAVGAALDLEAADQSPNAAQLLRKVADRIGYSHPWLVQELGRFLLITSSKEAKAWLERAMTAQHCWIAVTRSFLDATPTRRADGDAQSADLPHALPASQLGSVTRSRHTVVGMFPASKDAGLWQFPRMGKAAIPPDYTEEKLTEGLAVALGMVDRFQDGNLFQAGLRESTHVNWHQVQKRSREFLTNKENRERFWGHYIKERWNIDVVGIAELVGLPEVDDELNELIGFCRAVLQKIGERLAELPVDQEEGPFSFFKNGYVASDIRYFLDGSSGYIRQQILAALRARDEVLAQRVGAALYLDVTSVGAAAREAFDQAVGVAELIGQFRTFMPSLARLCMAEIAASCDGEKRSEESRQLDEFRQFVAEAFDETITHADFDYLRQTASDLAADDRAALASAIDFFVDRLKEEIDADREGEHCHFQLETSICVQCQNESTALIWEVINVLNRPDLHRLAKSVRCLFLSCLICGATRERTSPLFYCNPTSNLYLLLFPEMNNEDELRLRDATDSYLESLPSEYRGNRPMTAHVSKFVTGWSNTISTCS